MAKPKNHVIYGDNKEELERLRDEYAMLGRDTKLEEGRLIVFALPQKRRDRR